MADREEERKREANLNVAKNGSDEEIYDLLKVWRHKRHYEDSPETSMCYDIRLQTHPARAMDERPGHLPFHRPYIQELHDLLGNKGLNGAWHIPWDTKSARRDDRAYPDDFRTVLTFNTMEFMIRPPTPLRRDGTEPITVQ